MIDDLKVIVCADSFTTGYLPMLMAQLVEKDFNHELVMMEKPFAWKKKVKAWLDGLGDHHGKAAFLDAYDVLVFGSPEELYYKISHPLIFSGDRVCWPAMNAAEHYPPAPTPWQYVNCGGIAGYADDLRDFLYMIYGEMTLVYPPGKFDCEQWNATKHYLRGKGIIDHECRIFHCMLGDPPGTLAPVEFPDHRWMNTYTGYLPVFIHGQGKSFKQHPEIFPPLANYQDWNWY